MTKTNEIKASDLISVSNKETGAKAIVKRARELQMQADTLGHKLHIVLLSAVSHALAHKDTRIIDQVFDHVSSAMARGKIITWLTGLSNLEKKTIQGKDGSPDKIVFRKPEKEDLLVMFNEMMAKSPWTFSLDPQEKEFNLEKRLAAIVTGAAAKQKKGMFTIGERAKVIASIEAIQKLLPASPAVH